MSDLNFSIAYPEITWDALTVTASEASGFPVRNLFYNGSGVVWKRSGTATSTNITFDLGETKKSSANYCILRGINNVILQQGDKYGVTVQVRASIDNFVTNNVLVGSQNPIELVGTKDEDAVLLFHKTAEYRYWRVVIITATAIQHQLRKLFIGNLFDFNENNPFYPYISKYQETANAFVSDRGTLFKSSNGKKQKLIDIAWRNVLDSTRDFFQSRIVEAKDDSPFCFVHKDSMHNPLTVYKKPKTIADFKPVAYYKSTDVSKIFTLDSGGTLPAYGVGVGRWENAFGSAHATQATAGSRPIRSTAPITGVRNLLDRTEEFDNAYWTKNTTTITANTTTAPNGTLTADKVTANAAAGSKDVRRSLTVPNATVHTYSFYAKAAEYNFISTFVGFSNATLLTTYNLSNCTITATSPNAISFIEDAGNGWCRCSIRVTSNSTSGIIYTYINSDGTSGGTSFTGDGTSGIFLWGAQLEVASSPSNYQHRVTQHEVYEAGVPNRDYLWTNGSTHFLETALNSNGLTGATVILVGRSRASEGGVNASIFSYRDGATSTIGLQVQSLSSNTWIYAGGTTSYYSAMAGNALTNNGILSVVYDGTKAIANDRVFTYLNGTVTSKSSFAGTFPTSLPSATFKIGASVASSSATFAAADYYALLIFNKALTNADRQYVESLVSEDLQIANIQAPANTNPNLLTAWIREYEIESGVNANLNNVRLSLLEDII